MPLSHQERTDLTKFIKKQSLHIDAHIGWENFSENLKLPDVLVLDIEDIKSWQQLTKYIYQTNLSKPIHDRIIVRPAAGGHHRYNDSFSFTPGAMADVIIRLTGPDFHQVHGDFSSKRCKVGGSVQIGQLEQVLYDHYDLSLPTSSLIPYVTVAGLTGNAGHGTGLNQPSFAGLILAITFGLENGEIVRIDQTHPDFETIRGAHLGLFGVVLNVELACVEAKKILCILQKRTLPQLLQSIKEGLFDEDPYVSVMYVPTYQSNELTSDKIKNVDIYRFRPVDKTHKDHSYFPKWSDIEQALEVFLYEGFRVSDLLRQMPRLVPAYMAYIVSRISSGLKDHVVIGPWYSMHYQLEFPKNITDVDYLFQISPDYHEVNQAITQFVTTLDTFAKQKKYPITGPTYLRVFTGTNGGLSTSAHDPNHHTCGFDFVSSPGMPHYEAFRSSMDEFFIKELKAKPHWGKYLPKNFPMPFIYGERFAEFRNVLMSWYQSHNLNIERSMFVNHFFSGMLNLSELKQKPINFFIMEPAIHANVISEMAQRFADSIQENDPIALHLKAQLQQAPVIAHSSSWGRFFSVSDTDQSKEPELESKRWCRIA